MNEVPQILPLGPNRVWRTYLGGKTLDTLEGKAHPVDSHWPEDWIASTTRAINKGREAFDTEGYSRVDFGGETPFLKDVFERFPEAMLGPTHVAKHGAQTGFLLKLLDSAIRLHVQCHPTISFARERLDSPAGKTEGYVILGSREEVTEPYIYLGFQHPPTPKAFRTMIMEQRVDDILACFEKVAVQSGDAFLVPGGLPHAIGEGVFMVEIMEPTDLAVRIEFERGDYVLPEKARFLGHDVDFALDMFNYDPITLGELRERYFCKPRLVREYGSDSRETSLIDERMTGCFHVRRVDVNGHIRQQVPGFYVAVVSRGSGVVSAGLDRHIVGFGDRFFVPASAESVDFESEDGMALILALPPE